jgi:SAM-dependent methyltransferase
LVPKKGFDVLVEALPHVLQGHPQAQLVIGGTGPQAGELQQRARNLGVEARLHLPGTISWQDVPGFLAMADVFVLPSVRDRAGNTDGLPTVLLEALALGKPVVATEIAGVPLVVRSGANGLLCPPGDARALGSALSELLSDPDCRRRLGQAGRAAVEERFNWLAVARTLSGLFEGPAAQPARLRLGTQYRLACFREAGIEFRGERVLEVGAHDGSILATAHGKVRVGVDLEPAACPPGCHMVRADGNRLPFRSAAFDEVIAADVIEHVPDEQEFLAELQRATAAGGRLFLTTPSSHIRLFPNFLTGYISRSWGHVLRRGFAAPALQALAGPDAAVRDWSAPAYRLSYLPLRFLAPLFPGLAARAVRRTARYDAAHSQGQRGFYWLSWRKPHGQEAAN